MSIVNMDVEVLQTRVKQLLEENEQLAQDNKELRERIDELEWNSFQNMNR